MIESRFATGPGKRLSAFRATGCLWVLILVFAAVLAQDRNHKTPFPNIYEDQKQFWTSPFTAVLWQTEETWLLLVGSTSSFLLDGEPSRDLRLNDDFRGFNEFFASDSSDILLTSIPVFILAGGLIADRPGITELGWKSGEAVAASFLVTRILKLSTQRARPHTGLDYGFWEGGNSFPSGHAAYAWALATVTTEHFEEQKWLPWVLYPAAGLVSFSRITSGNHFVSDAVVGSVLGYIIGKHVIH